MFVILPTGFGKTLCFVYIPSVFDFPLTIESRFRSCDQPYNYRPNIELDAEAIISPIVDITNNI